MKAMTSVEVKKFKYAMKTMKKRAVMKKPVSRHAAVQEAPFLRRRTLPSPQLRSYKKPAVCSSSDTDSDAARSSAVQKKPAARSSADTDSDAVSTWGSSGDEFQLTTFGSGDGSTAASGDGSTAASSDGSTAASGGVYGLNIAAENPQAMRFLNPRFATCTLPFGTSICHFIMCPVSLKSL